MPLIHRIFDVWIMLVFGVLGYLMIKNNYPLAPMILAFVLAPLFETYLRRALMYSDSFLDILSKPFPFLFILSSILIVFWTLFKEIKGSKRKEVEAKI